MTAYQDASARVMSVQMSAMAFFDKVLALMLSAMPLDDFITSAAYSAALVAPEKPHLSDDVPAVLDDFDERRKSCFN